MQSEDQDGTEAPAPQPEAKSAKRLADGIYLSLPMEDYLADDALSGSKFFNLLTEAGVLTWESSANPLWEADEDASTRGQLRGSACHSAILEGPEAYAAAFCVAPEGVLKSGTDMEGWLKRAKASGREDMAALKTSGKVGELRHRIEEARKLIAEDDSLYPLFWDEKVGGRRVLTSQDDAYVRLLTAFVRRDPKGSHLDGGLAEVTIVLTLEGVRYKCRIDYMTAGCDLDLKSYGRPPNIDSTLKRHLIRGAFYNGAHLQAVHNSRMAAAAGALYRAGKLSVHAKFNGNDAGQEGLKEAIAEGDILRAIFKARETTPPIWRWLFVRMDGPPSKMLVPFRQSDGMWTRALEDIERAVDIYRDYSATCEPGELWFTDHGEQEIDDTDWPLGAWGGQM